MKDRSTVHLGEYDQRPANALAKYEDEAELLLSKYEDELSPSSNAAAIVKEYMELSSGDLATKIIGLIDSLDPSIAVIAKQIVLTLILDELLPVKIIGIIGSFDPSSAALVRHELARILSSHKLPSDVIGIVDQYCDLI